MLLGWACTAPKLSQRLGGSSPGAMGSGATTSPPLSHVGFLAPPSAGRRPAPPGRKETSLATPSWPAGQPCTMRQAGNPGALAPSPESEKNTLKGRKQPRGRQTHGTPSSTQMGPTRSNQPKGLGGKVNTFLNKKRAVGSWGWERGGASLAVTCCLSSQPVRVRDPDIKATNY